MCSIKRKLLIPIIIIAAAAICCIAAMVFRKPSEGSIAYIYQDGTEIARFPLDGSTDGEILTVTGEDGQENIIEIKDGSIHMRSADCKDNLCVKMGWRSSPGTPIVCLPNKVVIEVKDSADEQNK